jgi:hypothetical protein
MAQQIALEIVELYPHVEYMKYLLAGSAALARYVAVMLKDGGFTAIRFDLLFLTAFGVAALAVATPLFKRTLWLRPRGRARKML